MTSQKKPPIRALILGRRSRARWLKQEFHLLGLEASTGWELGWNTLFSQDEIQEKLQSVQSRFDCLYPGCTSGKDLFQTLSVAETLGWKIMAPATRIVSLFLKPFNLLLEAKKYGFSHLILQEEPLAHPWELERAILSFWKRKKKAPIVIRSAYGTGGIYIARQEQDLGPTLEVWFEQWKRQERELFVFLERFLMDARRVVVPFVRFLNGKLTFFPLVDASLQWKKQKLIEICPAFEDATWFPEIQRKMTAFLKDLNYVGIGQFEFLVEGKDVYFIEAHPGLGYGFPLWERVLKTFVLEFELQAHQISYKKKGLKTSLSAHSIGVLARFYAEDPYRRLPRPGTVEKIWNVSENHAFQLEIQEKEKTPLEQNGLLGSVIAEGETLEKSFQSFSAKLKTFAFGGTLGTNELFLKNVSEHPWVQAGVFHAAFLEEEFVWKETIPSVWKNFGVFLIEQIRKVPENMLWWVQEKRFLKKVMTPPLPWNVLTQHKSNKGVWGEVRFKEETLFYSLFPISDFVWILRVGMFWIRIRMFPLDGVREKVFLYALTQGNVHACWYQEGMEVSPGCALIWLRAFQKLVPHRVGVPVRVLKWKVDPEEEVTLGQVLAELEVFGLKKKNL